MTIRFLVTSLTKAPLPRLLNLAGWPALGRFLVVPNFFHLRMMEATMFLWTFNAADMFWYSSPGLCLDTILSRSSTDNYFNLMVFALTCTFNCGTQVCAFSNNVQSIEFTTGGDQSNCRNISRMINGNSYISSLIVKGLNNYINKVSVTFF